MKGKVGMFFSAVTNPSASLNSDSDQLAEEQKG